MRRETEELFHQLADLSPEERDAYFHAREVDAEIRAEVEELLRFQSETDHVLSASVAAVAGRLLWGPATAEGRRCGPYRLVRLLGRGGMGAVYLAERADGEITHQVAVKLLRYGVDDPAYRQRFLRERQILADLHHPNIATLLDAGHAEDGQPYLVMEYIDGRPIDAYCAGRSIREILALFIRVCGAAAYAHRNLVVHRDLKPSNILVDDSGQPKLLDFGIAKMLDPDASVTETREAFLTRDYASPEQMRGAALTTASDVYSLGAVLYKLLTDRAPGAGGAHPVPPSRSNRAVCRDLDNIVSKALRPEPDERYGSAEALADDLRAYLEFRPVRARAGTAWYRTRKFVRRYRMPVTAAILGVAGLAIGLVTANRERTLAQRRFEQVRTLANAFIFDVDSRIRSLPGATAARQAIVRTALPYLEGLTRDSGGDKGLLLELAAAYERIGDIQDYSDQSNLGDREGALASYNHAASILTALTARGVREATLPLASVHLKLGMLQRTGANVQTALAEFRQARQLCVSLLPKGGYDVLYRAGSISAQIAITLYGLHEANAAAEAAQSTVAIARRLTELDPRRPDSREALAGANSGVARVAMLEGNLEEAARSYRETVRIDGALAAEAPQNVSYRRNLGNAFINLGDVLGLPTGPNLGDTAGALDFYRKALMISEWLKQVDPADRHAEFDNASAHARLGAVMALEPGRFREARGEFKAARGIFTRLIASDPRNARYRYYVAYVDWVAGEALFSLGRERDAAAQLAAAAAEARDLTGGESGPAARKLLLLSSAGLAALHAKSRAADALALADGAARDSAASSVDYGSPFVESRFDRNLGFAYRRLGRTKLGVVWLEKAAKCLAVFHAPPALEAKRAAELAAIDAELRATRGH